MKFVYVGAGYETTAFGIEFIKGEAVEVIDEYAIKKLSNNPCFEIATEKEEEKPKQGRPFKH
jgi:hypothetical protein